MTMIPNGSPGASPPPAMMHAGRSRHLALTIERACNAADISIARFGRDTAGNPSLVLQLYSGNALRTDTRGRVLARLGELRRASAVRP